MRFAPLMAAAVLLVGLLGCAVASGVQTAPPTVRLSLRQAAYERARQLYLAGDTLAAGSTALEAIGDPTYSQGAESELNARLFELLGDITRTYPRTDETLFRAETYYAWAIAKAPSIPEYNWRYVAVRYEREGYSLLLARLTRHDAQEYPGVAWNSIIRIPGDTAESAYYLGLLQGYIGNYARALPLLEVYHDRWHSCASAQALAETYFATGRVDLARQLVSMPFPEGCENNRHWSLPYLQALLAERQGDTARAAALLLDAVRLDPTQSIPRRELAVVWSRSDQLERAMGELSAILKDDPSDWASWSAFWSVALEARDGGLAFARLAEVESKLRPSFAAPWVALAVSQLSAARFPEALAAANQAFDRDSSAQEAILAVLAAGAAVGKVDATRAAALRLDRVAPGRARQLLALGLDSILADASPAGAGHERVAEFLLRGTDANPESAVFQAALIGYLSMLAARGGADAGIATRVLASDRVVAGKKFTDLTITVAAQRRAIDELTTRGAALLLRIQGNEARLDLHQRQIQLVSTQVSELSRTIQAVRASLEGRLDVLSMRLARSDARTSATLDELARVVAANRRELASYGIRVATIEQWRRSEPRAVAGEVFRLSNYISIGPSFGFGSLNLLAVLEDLVHVIAA